jgi:hypothetical protein
MAVSARCCIAKRQLLRAVAQDGQARDAIDKLGVTGSSPVPPMIFPAKRQHRLPLSLTKSVSQDRIEREDDHMRRVRLSRSGRFVVSLTTQTLVISLVRENFESAGAGGLRAV